MVRGDARGAEPQPGLVGRRPEDRVTQRDNGSTLNYVVHPDGFMTYRVIGASPHAFRRPFGNLIVQDFCPITPRRTPTCSRPC